MSRKLDHRIKFYRAVSRANALRKEIEVSWFVCNGCRDLVTGYDPYHLRTSEEGDERPYCESCLKYCKECDRTYEITTFHLHDCLPAGTGTARRKRIKRIEDIGTPHDETDEGNPERGWSQEELFEKEEAVKTEKEKGGGATTLGDISNQVRCERRMGLTGKRKAGERV